ncbi:hypothetical protein ACFXHA_45440 [Nocardia sp. NPDC059240]|uniref:hypothetical protein n=1 Tax=Nocardia sp. NPDC059240 TaxID=3346786 RepID=UPI003673F33B
MTAHPPSSPPPRLALLCRALLVLAAVVALAVCGAGIGAAQPGGDPTSPPPTLVTPTPTPTAPTSVPPGAPRTSGVPAPARPGEVPGTSEQGGGGDQTECGVTHIPTCVADAIDGFFHRVVDSALNPLLELFSRTLLTTPEPSDLPAIGQLWDSSWQLMVGMYALVVLAAGIVLMVHETLQTRWGWRELLPRLVAGFVGGAMSLILATKAIQFANALAGALAGDGVDPTSASAAFKSMMHVGASTGTPLFLTLMYCALMVVLEVLGITYVVRVAITIVLIVAAPLAMMCYALPGTESIARWWLRSFGACLAIQIAQSLVLIVGLRVFLTPNAFWLLGPNKTGLVTVTVALAMGILLIKIPFWLLSALKLGHGRGMATSMVRGFVMYKTLGLLKGTGKTAPRRSPSPPTNPPAAGGAAANPYANVAATRSGQLILPLPGIKRVRPAPAPAARIPHAASIPLAPPQGQQLMLPLPQFHGGVALGPTPQLGSGGQYQLPIPVTRVPKPTPPAPTPPPPVPKPTPGQRGSRPKQLAFDYTATDPDPYAGLRPGRGGQYALPLNVRRVPAQPRPATPPSVEKPASISVGRQLHLPMPDLPVRRRHRRHPGGTR